MGSFKYYITLSCFYMADFIKDTRNPFTRCYDIAYFARPCYTSQSKRITIDKQII